MIRDVTPGAPRWVRSPHGMIAGVCQGLAESLGLEVWVFRLAFLVSVIFAGSGLWLYFMLAISLPLSDQWEKAERSFLLGVCGRIARKTQLELGVVRFLTLSLAILSLGSTVLVYVLLYFLMPEE